MVFSKLGGKNMGIYLWGNEFTLRPVILDRFDYGSDAYDWRHLDLADARLVGVKDSASGAEGEASKECAECVKFHKHVKEEH